MCKMNFLKCMSFGLAGLLVAVLAAATVLEKLQGTSFVVRWIYSSPVFVALWAFLALFSVFYLFRRVKAFTRKLVCRRKLSQNLC